MSYAKTFTGFSMISVSLPHFEQLKEEEKTINTWEGPDGNVYEWDLISNILYDIDNGDYLGDKDEYEDYLIRTERVEPWTAPNGKTYNLDPITNNVYENDNRTNLGDKDEFEKDMKKQILEEERKRYEKEPHILIENWGGPRIDVRNAGKYTDFVVNELIKNIIRLRNIDEKAAKVLRTFVSFKHV